MFLLLVASAALYFLFGDVREGITLSSFVVVMISITVIQEGRTERALDALRDLSAPKAKVERDGVTSTIDARELVRGDVIVVAEGDRVPADSLLREGTALSVDESLLTGESTSVIRHPDTAGTSLRPIGGDDGTQSSSLFSGTLVVSGRGRAEVVVTGPRSEIGKIGTSLAEVHATRTPLEREIDKVVRTMAILGASFALVLVLVLGLGNGEWKNALLSGITLAMALLPEEFPVVLTVFLALGAWRIAKGRVLTRRMAAVETLGGVHVLCTDKTGTLTKNQMSVTKLVAPDEELDLDEKSGELPESVHQLVEMSILASPRDPFDPMERAFVALGERTLGATEHLHPNWEPRREYPISSELLAVTWAWRPTDDDSARTARTVIATKGAPEAIFDLCHLDPARTEFWRSRAAKLAESGLRVLGVAYGEEGGDTLPEHPHDFDFEMAGLVGLLDPLRDDVKDAIASCRRAGVRVMMITGDYPITARAIADSAGLDAGRVITGAEIDGWDDAELATRLADASVIARAAPAHKLRIVRSLRARGEVVGMTGDGVNDAPALKAADIGIAMGKRGTDVAREAAALVLVEDDFGSIVHAVRIGRRIYDNLQKAVSYIVAVHVPIAGISLLPALLGYGTILTPVLVVFLELIIDPACSIVFEMESEEPSSMLRKPRAANARLFTPRGIAWSVLQGLLVFVGTFVVLFYAHAAQLGEAVERTLVFVMLVLGNVVILLANRSIDEPLWRSIRRKNPAVPWFLAGVAGLLTILLGVPWVRGVFGFTALDASWFWIAFAASVLPVFLLDAKKARSKPTIPGLAPVA